MSALRNLSPLSKLSLFVVILLIVAIFTTISFSLRQQSLISKMWSVSESAKAQCNEKGEAEIAVKFRNIDSSDSKAMNVVVKDVQTGLMVDLGTVDSSNIGTTAAIQTHRKQIDGSSVIFFLSWTNNASGTGQRGATYSQVSCEVTPTVKAENTYFNLDVVLQGIGTRGNQNPVTKTRSVMVEVVDGKNQLVASKSGELNYASDSGHFAGTIDMGNILTDGVYLIKVKADKYLQAVLSQFSVRAGKVNRLGGIDLVTGDVNNDNVINILDYNLLISNRDKVADLTDDGNVNKFDYNLFFQELTTSAGK
jgi:hypothetical protein